MKYTTLLKNATVEKDVESAYKHAFLKYWPDADISSPYGSDGEIKHGAVRLLCEMKHDKALKSRVEMVKPVGQLIFYLKKHEEAGDALPNVLFVGDMNECFVIETSIVKKYLKVDIDWSMAPSASHPELEMMLFEDTNVAPFVYDVHEKVDFADVIEKIENLALGENPRVKATPDNLERLFGIWEDRIFKDHNQSKEEQLSPQKRVEAFLKCLFYPEDAYLHPNKKNILKVNRGAGISVKVDATAYRGFFDTFHQGYSPSEIDAIYAIQDRLIEETARRYEGAFYTPKIWVDEAHRMLDEALGSDWRDTHLVLDVAAGTANLTRDYNFKHLVLSTLNQEDVDVILEQGYNRGAVVEKWDFLSGEIPKSIEQKLVWARDNDVPVVFFSNPPYGTAGNYDDTHKAGIALNAVCDRMKNDGIGSAASQQLYAQFMFQVDTLVQMFNLNTTMAFYTKAKYVGSAGYVQFCNYLSSNMKFVAGSMFPANDFTTKSKDWGVFFSIWTSIQ